MQIAVACPCGSNFEIAEVQRGRSVRCPDCDRVLRSPMALPVSVRTSGYALTGVVLALVGLFTVVLTAVATLLGLIALVQIARNRGRVAGRGYAVFAIVLGAVFTPLSLFAYSKAELFDPLRERILGKDVDRSGPLEVVRPEDGFAITRPSERWGIVSRDVAENLSPGSSVLLAQPARDTYLDVTVEGVFPGQSLETSRQQLLEGYRKQPLGANFRRDTGPRATDLVVRRSQRLPDRDGLEVVELFLELRCLGQKMTYLVWILKRPGMDRQYVLTGWAQHRRFAPAEVDLRRGFDSFRELRR